MNSLQRATLPEVVAAELRNRLESGAMKGELPGVRMLSKAIGVSIPTLCRALHMLEDEGLLQGGGGRRRWRSVETSDSEGKGRQNSTRLITTRRPGRLLYLSSHPLSSEKYSGVEAFAQLLDQLGNKGWDVTHRVVPFTTARSPRKSWDELLRLAHPDAIVVNAGTPMLAEWVLKKGIRAIFLGGDPGKSSIPLLGVSTSMMLRQTLDRLLALGHQSILVPLCGRPASFITRFQETARQCTAAVGLAPGCVTVVDTAYASPEVLVDLFRKQWSTNVPDGLVLIDWREMVAAMSFFQGMGIRIPEDLSVVILSHNPSMDWHLPPITHFEFPINQMVRTIVRWALDGASSYNPEPLSAVRARWVEAKSVIPRKKTRGV